MEYVDSREQAAFRRFSKAVQLLQNAAVMLLVLLTLYVLLNPLSIRTVDVIQKDCYTYWPR